MGLKRHGVGGRSPRARCPGELLILLDSSAMKRVLPTLLCLSLTYSPVFAEKTPEPPFSIAERHGAITEVFPGGEKSPRQWVVMIQDLHANVGVQKNIAAVLYRLQKMNDSQTLVVCVEGASGEGDVSLLRSLPRFVRRGFEALLLRKAYLTGAELAATEAAAEWAQEKSVLWNRVKSWFKPTPQPGPVSLSPILLWGVDDPDLYRKNWRAAKFVDSHRNTALTEIKSTRAVVATGATAPMKKQLDLVVRLLLLRLQPKEYLDYVKGRALNPRGSKNYEETVKAAETYYLAAEQRSTAMVKNLLARMGHTPGYTALISGGFHTQEMAEQLKAKNIPYVVITPHVKVLDQDDAYRARLREEE